VKPPAPWLLLAGDAACLAAFVFLGLGSHAELANANTGYRFLVNAGPLIVTWGIAAYALGALRWPAAASLRTVWARTLTAWLVAAPLALLVRAQLLGAATLVVIFMLVTLAVGGALLLLWRSVCFWLVRRRA
jgi:hypothetical protein